MQKDRRRQKCNYAKNVSAKKLTQQHLSDSQNFITDGRLIRRIVGFADFHEEDTVLEIGTGKGHLTEALCRRAGRVCSVEKDSEADCEMWK